MPAAVSRCQTTSPSNSGARSKALSSWRPAKFKRFRDGLAQLLKEGVAQAFELPEATQRIPLLSAVGPLQFEVLQYRLESEYGAECRVESAPWNIARWLRSKEPEVSQNGTRPQILLPSDAVLARDVFGEWVVLLASEWSTHYLTDKNPGFVISALPGARQAPDPTQPA